MTPCYALSSMYPWMTLSNLTSFNIASMPTTPFPLQNSPPSIQSHFSNHLSDASAWMAHRHLTLNVAKTKLLVVAHKRLPACNLALCPVKKAPQPWLHLKIPHCPYSACCNFFLCKYARTLPFLSIASAKSIVYCLVISSVAVIFFFLAFCYHSSPLISIQKRAAKIIYLVHSDHSASPHILPWVPSAVQHLAQTHCLDL